MELLVLGNGAAYPGPRQACSGYLVRKGRTRLLIECGNGVVSKLQEAGEPENLSALLFTHLHADHLLDIFSLFYSRVYGRRDYPPLPLFLPPSEADRLARLAEVLRVEPRRVLEGAFRVSEYDPVAGLTVGDLRVSFSRNEHPVPTYALRIESDGASLVYTSDTAPYPGLGEFASGCDLLLSEATLREEDYDPAHPLHLTPRLAAELALRAGAQRLLLTHIWPHYDRRTMLEQARALFPAAELAEELVGYRVSGVGGQGPVAGGQGTNQS